jgi:hypothetical protein
MAEVRVTWIVEASVLTSGPVVDHILVALGGGIEDRVAALHDTAVVFAQVPPGDYQATVQLIALDATPLGPPARTTPFTVAPGMTMLMLYVGHVGLGDQGNGGDAGDVCTAC